MSAVNRVGYIPATNWPKSFGSLIKNIQSLSSFKDLFQGRGYLRNNKKSVDEYIEQHTSAWPLSRNNALEDKKTKIKTSTEQYLLKHQDDYKTIIHNRKGLFFPSIDSSEIFTVLPENDNSNPII